MAATHCSEWIAADTPCGRIATCAWAACSFDHCLARRRQEDRETACDEHPISGISVERVPPVPLFVDQTAAVMIVRDELQILDPQQNARDKEFGGPRLIYTEAAAALVKAFWANYNDPGSKWKQLCIESAFGTGKSCAVKILVADICRKIPAAKVYYYREALRPSFQDLDFMIVSAEKTATFLIVDQVTNSQCENLARVSAAGVWLIMVSSENLPYFRRDSEGRNYRRLVWSYSFSSTPNECAQLATLLDYKSENKSEDKIEAPPKLPLSPEAVLLPLPKSLPEFCQWTCCHLLSVAAFVRGETPVKMLNGMIATMGAYLLDQTHFRSQLLRMFKTGSTQVVGVKSSHHDFRYLDAKGRVLCPAFYQAYQQTLALGLLTDAAKTSMKTKRINRKRKSTSLDIKG